MKLLFLLAVCRLVLPLYIKTKDPYNFANNSTETKGVIHVQNQRDLVGAGHRHNSVRNNEKYSNQNTTDQQNNVAKEFSSKSKKEWKLNRTMLEKFYDYVKKERELLENEMETTNLQHKTVMKIPRKKYQNTKRIETAKKSKREASINTSESPKSTEHISRIKEEITKLQELVTILRDQQQIINLLDDMKNNGTGNIGENNYQKVDIQQKSNVFSKELNDLKHYVKRFLADKLETEIQTRRKEGENLNKHLESQQTTINNMKTVIRHLINSTGSNNDGVKTDLQIETTKDIIGQLHDLENHITEMLNNQQTPKDPILGVKDPTVKDIARSSSKMRQSTLEDLLDDNPSKSDDSESLLKILQRELDQEEKPTHQPENNVKKLLKLVDDAKKKKKQKDFIKKILKTMEDKPEDRNLDIDDELDEKLSFLKDEIDELKPKDDDEDLEERKFGDVLKKLLAQSKPVVTKQINTNHVDGLRKKLLQVMKQQTPVRTYHQPQSKYNLFNCKHVQAYLDQQQHAQNPNMYPYYGQLELNPNQNFGIPNNIQQNNFDQLRYNFGQQFFPDTNNQPYQNQQVFTGPYSTEYQTDGSQYFNAGAQDNLKNQIDGLQNIINDLSSPGHVQRYDDKSTLYNLNQQVTDLKNVLNNFEINKNQYSNSDYLNQAFNNQNNYQSSGVPTTTSFDQNQAYVSNPNPPVIANPNPNYRSSENEDNKKKSKSSNQFKNEIKAKHKRSTDESIEDLLNKILKEEIETQEYNDNTQNIDNSITLRSENERCFRRR